MKTGKGLQTNSIFGVASMLIQILKTESPDAILFCFDEGDETFRHKEYKEYKAGRAETPDDFYVQIPEIFRLIDTFGVRRVSNPGFEADDLLCAYAREGSKKGQVTIITGDRDAFQLIDGNVRVAIPAKGYQIPEYLTAEKVKEKYGVTPEQIPSYKGLVGDSSDNLKGVNGIGPKAASDLIQKYGSIKEIYAHIDEIKPAWKEKLVRDKEQAFFCERMAQLVYDFPLPASMDDITLRMIDLTPVFELFKEFEFTLLTKRLQAFLLTDFGKRHFTSKTVSAASETRTPESAQLSML